MGYDAGMATVSDIEDAVGGRCDVIAYAVGGDGMLCERGVAGEVATFDVVAHDVGAARTTPAAHALDGIVIRTPVLAAYALAGIIPARSTHAKVVVRDGRWTDEAASRIEGLGARRISVRSDIAPEEARRGYPEAIVAAAALLALDAYGGWALVAPERTGRGDGIPYVTCDAGRAESAMSGLGDAGLAILGHAFDLPGGLADAAPPGTLCAAGHYRLPESAYEGIAPELDRLIAVYRLLRHPSRIAAVRGRDASYRALVAALPEAVAAVWDGAPARDVIGALA